MSAFEQAVVAVIKKHEGKKLVITSGVVSEVREKDCDVKREGKSPLLNVRLNSAITEIENFVRITPKKDSIALCGMIEGSDTEAFLLSCSEVEKYTVKINGSEFIIDGSFVFKNEQSDLKDIMIKTIDQIIKSIITTPAGPGQFSPADILVFNEQKSKINKLFK